jgi:hypothetical protein
VLLASAPESGSGHQLVLAGGGTPAEFLVGFGVAEGAEINAHRLPAGMAPVAEGHEVAHASALVKASIDAGDRGRLAAHRHLGSAASLATLSGMRGPPEVVVVTRTLAPAGVWLVYASSASLLSVVLLQGGAGCFSRASSATRGSALPLVGPRQQLEGQHAVGQPAHHGFAAGISQRQLLLQALEICR